MNSARWIGLWGAGMVLSACNGYSSLGELANGGGESGQGDGVGGSQSMGAKGGQGRGGTRTTGGAQGMGASPGMGGGNSMGAVGGTGMGGGNSMGAVGGDGMGGAGSGSQPIPCMTVDECPAAPPACELCEDGTTVCPEPYCSNGACGVYQALCPGMQEPSRCMVDTDCIQPPCVEGSQCPEIVCANGYCGATLPGVDPPCANLACGDPCIAIDGTTGFCDADSECTSAMPDCGSQLPTFACMSDGDCEVDLDCIYCGEGVCADTGCLANRCEVVCPTEFMCDSPMDCPKDMADDPCTTGPWECVRGFCARQYETCSAPAP